MHSRKDPTQIRRLPVAASMPWTSSVFWCAAYGLSQVAYEGAGQCALVDSTMLVKTFVFCRDESLLDMKGNLSKGHPDAALIRLIDFCELCALQVEHDAGPWKLHTLETSGVG